MKKKFPWRQLVFAAYCAVMLLMLFNRRVPDYANYWRQVAENLSLVPLRTVRFYIEELVNGAPQQEIRHAVINLAGNVLVFVPLGYFLPMLFRKCRTLYGTVLASAAGVAAVEIAQLFTLRGSCDIDDLLLNLVGVLAGYGIFRISALLSP